MSGHVQLEAAAIIRETAAKIESRGVVRGAWHRGPLGIPLPFGSPLARRHCTGSWLVAIGAERAWPDATGLAVRRVAAQMRQERVLRVPLGDETAADPVDLQAIAWANDQRMSTPEILAALVAAAEGLEREALGTEPEPAISDAELAAALAQIEQACGLEAGALR